MSTNLAWSNLKSQPARSVLAVAGIAFAVTLVFVQLGFLGSAEATATLLYDPFDFDLILHSTEYVELSQSDRIPRLCLSQAEAVPGVARAVPLYLGSAFWRNAVDPGQRRMILLIAFPPEEQLFRRPEMAPLCDALKQRDTVLVDRRSRGEFGPIGVGTETELGPRLITVAGNVSIGTGYTADGLVLTSDETWSGIMAGRRLDNISVGLVKLAPGADPGETAAALRRTLPANVRVRTRAELVRRERDYWIGQTAIGVLFNFGVAVGLLVGIVFVYQVVSSDVVNRLGEYATLKSLGYGDAAVAAVVLQQALILAAFAYGFALAVSLVLYEVTRRAANVPIDMTAWRAGSVLIMTLGMCIASGLAALRKLRTADPADLF